MKTLALDIETAPSLAYVWKLWKEDIPLARLVEPGYMMCYAASWMGSAKVEFHSIESSEPEMVESVWHLLDKADAVLHYNGKKFDIPHINSEFFKHDLAPPSPYKQIDLYSTVRKKFRFASGKLDHIAQIAELGGKKAIDFETWEDCMHRDPNAWERMKRYNIQDVRLLKRLYHQLLPWISSHPNVALYGDAESDQCPKCGAPEADLIKRGYAYTQVGKFQQYRCAKCGSWSRGAKALARVDLREVQQS